jgi:hypothetical protein
LDTGTDSDSDTDSVTALYNPAGFSAYLTVFSR